VDTDDFGRVRVYQFDGSEWVPLGADIVGDAAYEFLVDFSERCQQHSIGL
jgi:hypothetical protein